MRIPFRQGLVRVPANFLQLSAGKVSLVLGQADTIIAVIADGTADYLITDRLSVSNAWVGPFISGTDYWLYFDLNPITGVRTFGHTIYQPVDGPSAPATPHIDQHWFDTSVNRMKVWNGNGWVQKLRVFAAKLQQGSVFVSMSIDSPVYTGTQVGSLAAQPVLAGALVYDGTGAPLRKADNTFFTTEDVAITGIASSSQVKFGSIVIEAVADSNLPAYSVVRFTDFNLVRVATNYLVDNGAYGIVERAVATGEIADIVMEGLITNPAWDWTSVGINAALYVDTLGGLTPVASPTAVPVAAVVDKHTILLRPSSLFLNTFNDPATAFEAGNVAISVPPANPDLPIAVGDNDPRITAVLPHVADYTVHLSNAQNTFLDTLASTTAGIVARKSDNTGTTVQIVAPASGITVTNGDGTSGNPTLVLSNDLAAVEGLTTTGSAVRTGTDAWVTRQLVVAANSAAGLVVTNGDGVLGNPTIAVDHNLKGVQDLNTAGIPSRSGTGAWTTVSVSTNDTPGLTVTDGDGVAGNPTISFSGDLQSLTHQTGTGLAARTQAGTWDTRTLASVNGGLAITNGDGVAGDPAIELADDIESIQAITSTGIAVRKGDSDWDVTTVVGASGEITIANSGGFVPGPTPTIAPVTVGLQNIGTPVTAAFKKITTDAKGRVSATANVVNADIIASLGYTPLDVAGTIPMSNDLDMANFNITNVATPINGNDAANKSYVDSVAQGLDPKESVKAASAGSAVILSGTQVVDNVSLNTGDRVLVKDQADPTTHGIYVVNSGGAWTLATDSIPGASLTPGAFVFVEAGDLNAKTGWVLSAPSPIIQGSTSLMWQQFSGTGEITTGPGLKITGNMMSVVPSAANTITITNSNIDLTAIPTIVGGSTYKSVTVDTWGRIVAGTNPTTISGYGIVDAQPLNANLTNLSSMGTTGVVVRSGTNTFTNRTLVGIGNQIAITIGDGTTGNPTIGLAADPVVPGNGSLTVPNGTSGQEVGGDGALRYNNTTATMRMHESGGWKDIGTLRTINFTAPALGFTVTQTNPTSAVANVSFSLNGELAGIQNISTFGMAARTNTGTWATRTIQGTTNRIVISNGNGIAADPTIDLASNVVTVGTYRSVTVDTYGRVTAGTNPTTISGYGITDAQPLAVNLTQLTNFNTNGFVVQNSANSFVGRTWSVYANSNTNLSITNGDGVSGNPSIGLVGDLLAISQLSAVGFAVRTGAQTWAQRQLTGAVNQITITNGNGVSLDPVIGISAAYAGQASITTVGTINAGTWQGTPVAPQYGGTGLSSLGGGNTVFGMNAGGSAGEYKTVNGTANQVVVTHGVGTITLSTPQNIGTSSDVQFNKTTVNQAQTNVQALTDAATVTFNLNSGTHATLLATGAVGATRALANPTNMTAGTVIIVKFMQDATGSRGLTFGSAYKFAGGSAPIFTAQSGNAVNILTFWCDGTYLYEQSRSLAIA